MLDKRKIAHSFSRAAQTYDAAAIIQETVRNEQLDRLDLLSIKPDRILDLGSGTGIGSQALSQRYPRSNLLSVDIAIGMLEKQGESLPRFRSRIKQICADQDQLPFADDSVDMVFSNLTMQWSHQLDAVLSECRRVLRKDGVLTFTTVGPDTLHELRDAWQQVDENVPVHHFPDMHDVGDALIRAGFAEPVLDVEYYTLTYPNLHSLLKDLKDLGATYSEDTRSRSGLTRETLRKLEQAYKPMLIDGKLPLTYEVVFAQAWIPAQNARPQDGSTVSHFPAADIKRRYG